VVGAADAVADERPDDREAGLLDDPLDRRRDVPDTVVHLRLLDPCREGGLGDLEQPLVLRRDVADAECVRGIGHVAVERDADVDREEVAVLDDICPGIPWTIIAFGEMQIAFGKPR
jgi:hypothetical protein